MDAKTRLLILGSLPGDASLHAGQYYAHPRNGFWRLVGGVIGRDLVSLSYPDRLAALSDAHIGLWDVVAEAERPGSLDTAIRDLRPVDLRGLVARLPLLRMIAFNGATAGRLGRRSLGEPSASIKLINLPSSSPAHARPLSEKAAAWALLAEALIT